MNKSDYISEFEELLKIKEFQKDSKMKMPFDCTYEQIAKALKHEYAENINEKINRWINVTHIQYFENSICIIYYFQAKMLYRDGFYESAIMLVRSICEMICYDLLSKNPHPFGDLEQIEVPTFRAFVNFLAMPKLIEKKIFEEQIVNKITILDDKNFIKSSYELDKATKVYKFKIDNGRDKKNLERFFELFKQVNFNTIDCFRNDTHQLLHEVYDIGNLYVHAKKNPNPPKEDAVKCLNILTHILSDIYSVKDTIVGKTIKSGYSDFPDICVGMNFAMEFASSPEEAQRIYLNVPHKKYFDLLFNTVGKWNGEWKNGIGKNVLGVLSFFWESPEHLNANLTYINDDNIETIEPMEIKLFGNYFQIKGFDINDKIHKKGKHIFFELEFFNDNLLIGDNLDFQGKVIFKRDN